ncbi:hypothetical protein Gotri_025371 [Gossypium trilobum]|uniref:Uncharacterized protein n=2 Tax=Gossypium trilobum TaxID=34281 RepID=A0A7J9FWH7_9ROSI|nr:hypothetical protein [Gossypium trilobum]
MSAGVRVKVDSSDVHSYYSHGSTVISEKFIRRINDNIPEASQENSQSIEEHLWVILSELEIIKQDFETRNAELEKKIEQMEEEKMNLILYIDVQKLEAEKLRKGKNKDEEDLDSLKTDYKKLRLSMRTVGLGKTLEQWCEEIQEEKKQGRWMGNEIPRVNLETNQPTKHHYSTRAKTKDMDQRLEKLEQFQKEMQDRLQLQMREQLDKIQQDMTEKILESQKNMMAQLTQLLAGGNDKGKGPMANAEE